ncbi:hypothetical protein RVR_6579 [Actinacidiphila reveromycinica]|uniref:DUF397 domain-containing protein n=1 Tax=Actinacidiphila reveromycinica TaxID=659352 RepID=A0A7U3VQH3_9ACTN|nr:DUF397 domain-containing protein [Streptomyces sp. SN-593]BBA99800.1 hypothetical protein RVR_6579 [Streptomyces sp. SN-593]
MSIIPDPADTAWVKSSYSGGEGGNCLEWAPTLASRGTVPVRDSKDPHGPALTFTPSAWTAFVTAVRSGELPTA